MEAETQRGFGHSRRRIAVEIGALIAGLVLIVLFVFWLASMLAGWLVEFVPTSADVAVGEAAFSELAPPDLRCTDPGPQAYVEAVAEPLLAALDDDRFAFRFVVIDRPEINAFALPGGFVAVHMGLLTEADSGEELAGVLAHEIHHVTERHGFVRVLRSAGGRIILALVVGWGDVGMVAQYGSVLADVRYDRDQEREADRKGRALLARAGIDPGALGAFFARVKAKHGDAAIGFLSTHPGHDERIRAANADSEGFTPSLSLPAPPADLRCR
jgi:predicted Zn-dependent protease